MAITTEDLVYGESKWNEKQNRNNHTLAAGIDNLITDTGWVVEGFTILNGFSAYTTNLMDSLGYKIYYKNGTAIRLQIKGSLAPAMLDSNTAEVVTVPKNIVDFFGSNPQVQSHWLGYADTGQQVNLNISLPKLTIGMSCTGKISDLHRFQVNCTFNA